MLERLWIILEEIKENFFQKIEKKQMRIFKVPRTFWSECTFAISNAFS